MKPVFEITLTSKNNVGGNYILSAFIPDCDSVRDIYEDLNDQGGILIEKILFDQQSDGGRKVKQTEEVYLTKPFIAQVRKSNRVFIP